MSISKVFHTLIGDKSIVLQSTDFHEDHVIFHGRLRSNAKRCPYCKCHDVIIKETKQRTFRMVNLEKKRTYLKIDTYKIFCRACNKRSWMRLPFACGKLPMSRSLIDYILQLTAMTTLLTVALFLGLNWRGDSYEIIATTRITLNFHLFQKLI